MEQKLDNIKSKTLSIILVSVLVGALLDIGGYYLGQKRAWDEGYQSGYNKGAETEKATCSLDAKDSVSNPMDNMPSANPFEESVNPFK